MSALPPAHIPPASERRPPTVLIAANPYSGARANRLLVEALVQELHTRGLEAMPLWDPVQRHDLLADPQLANWCPCVVAAGGDGTVTAVLNAQRSVPVAVMPLGNENLLARELGMTADPGLLARAIAAGKTRTMSLGRIGDRYFTLMVSAGIDAHVVHLVHRWRAAGKTLRRVGHVSYFRPALHAALGYRFPRVELLTENVRVTGAHVLVFNVPRYGLDLQFVERGNEQEAGFQWVVFQKPGRWALLRYLLAVQGQRHLLRKDVVSGRALKVQLRSTEEVPCQVDGDPAGSTPVDLEYVSEAARLVVP